MKRIANFAVSVFRGSGSVPERATAMAIPAQLPLTSGRYKTSFCLGRWDMVSALGGATEHPTENGWII